MSSRTYDGVLPAIPGYRLGGQVGRGGFGVVYVGHADAGQPVAIKVLHRVLDDDARRRFDSEIQIMGTLGWHPHIVRILDAGAVDGQPFIVMEYLPDGSLGSLLRDDGPQPWADVLRHGVDAATALQVAHNADLLHRDIKPDNLLRTPEGRVKLSDFGVTVAASGGDGQRGATGTLAYSAPELLGGASPSPASDIYALGATMFALLSGDPAFHRTTDESPAAMVLRAYRDPLPDLRPSGAPESVVRVVERAMAKDPASRPATAADLVKELRGAADAESVPLPSPVPTGQHVPAAAAPVDARSVAAPSRPSARARARARRLQRVAGGLTAVAALVIAVSVVTVSDFGRAPDGEGAPPPPAAAPEDAAPDAADEAPAPADVPLEDGPPAIQPDAPPPSASPVPAAPPPPPAPAPAQDLPALALAAAPIGGAGDDRRSVVATATTLEVYDLDGSRTASTSVSGITDLAITGDVIAAASGQDVVFLDADSLAPTGRGAVPGLAEITGAGGSFWVATDTGLVRITTDGVATPVRGVGAPLTHIAAANGVVWTSTDDGDLVLLDGGSGRILGGSTVDGKVTELAARPGGMAYAVVDGQLLQIDAGGGVQPIDLEDIDPDDRVLDVAVTDGGTVYVLTSEGLGRLTNRARSTLPVTAADVQDLWPSGPVVLAAVNSPPTVERFG